LGKRYLTGALEDDIRFRKTNLVVSFPAKAGNIEFYLCIAAGGRAALRAH
jgi:hypothetical protein